MKKLLLIALLFPSFAKASSFDYSLSIKSLYGYSTQDDKSHLPTEAEINLSYEHDNITFYLDLYAGIDKENQTYNQGNWGEEAYAIITNPWGDVQIGQMQNVASQFYVGAFENIDFDITDFIANTNWQRNDNITSSSTFDTTAIDTDGVATKISYITPEFYDTYLGFSYTPDAYSRTGLTTKTAKQGYVASLLNYQDFGKIDVTTSLSYAYFNELDEEYSASLKLSYGNYYLSGGYRHSSKEGNNPITTLDGYRNATSYDVGLGFNFGPYQANIAYLYSQSDDFYYKDEYITLYQSYQLNKNFDIYLIGAYADFNADNPQDAYAIITGIQFNL